MRVIVDVIYSNKRRDELDKAGASYCEITRALVEKIIQNKGYYIVESYNGINCEGVGDLTFVIDFSGADKELKDLKKLIKKSCDYNSRAVCVNKKC